MGFSRSWWRCLMSFRSLWQSSIFCSRLISLLKHHRWRICITCLSSSMNQATTLACLYTWQWGHFRSTNIYCEFLDSMCFMLCKTSGEVRSQSLRSVCHMTRLESRLHCRLAPRHNCHRSWLHWLSVACLARILRSCLLNTSWCSSSRQHLHSTTKRARSSSKILTAE